MSHDSSHELKTAIADMDGVLPEGFHSTTNFDTFVCVGDQWIEVENIEMDVAIRIHRGEKITADTVPMHRVKKGDEIVVGYGGVKIHEQSDEGDAEHEAFKFMGNDISSERPKLRMIQKCASDIKHAHQHGRKVLLVGGPAIIHSGCASILAGLIMDGWIDVLFAGNALAAHDIEAAMYDTSLGVDLELGRSVPHGHSHHLRAINKVRRAGSIANAVKEGLITTGAMHACIKKGIPYVLAGSIRDDGPLPDVITDNVAAQDAMRTHMPLIGVAIMTATTLHSVATGNMLPASVKTYCIDSDADTVIKLTDRGTHQAIGIVTDCEFFMRELARQLA